MNREFPAQETLDQLDGTLAKAGWRALKIDWQNPDTPTVVRKRGSFADSTKHPSVFVHQWAGDWEDSQGNIVTYFLRYISKFDPATSWSAPGPDNSTLRISAARIPKAYVDRMRQAAASRRP
jgi:hypothetical protein